MKSDNSSTVSRNLCAVMISIPERQEMRKTTLDGFSRFGIFPEVFEQQDLRRGGEAHKNNVIAALEAASTEFVLFCEDDLEVGNNFPKALEVAIRARKHAVTFYLSSNKSFYPSPIKWFLKGSFPPPEEGLYKVCNRKLFFGSQCVLLHQGAICKLLKWEEDDYFDTRIGRLVDDFWFYFPNPIQHAGSVLKSTWSPHGQSHRSITYGMDI